MAVVGWAPPEHPMEEALEAMSAALDGATGAPAWSVSDDRLAGLLDDASRLESRLHELTLRIVGEVDRRRASERTGATSTPAWPRRRLRMSPSDAKQRTTLATALMGRLNLTRDALAAGDVSRAHAQVVVKVMDTLPSGIGPTARADAERQLIAWSREFDPESAAIIAAVLDPLAKPLSSTAEGPDPRPPHQRYADALVELCRRQLESGDLPTRGGEKPQIVVTMSLDKLERSVASGRLDTGDRLSPGTVRKLACDAQVIPALLGTDGQPLDLGRTSRTFTPAQRKALGLRDGGCAFPGCDRPPAWCEGHHIRYWIDGGPTDIDNGVILCCYHHTIIHQGDWVIQMAADGRPDFIPPTWIDPDRRPIRNHCHRLN